MAREVSDIHAPTMQKRSAHLIANPLETLNGPNKTEAENGTGTDRRDRSQSHFRGRHLPPSEPVPVLLGALNLASNRLKAHAGVWTLTDGKNSSYRLIGEKY